MDIQKLIIGVRPMNKRFRVGDVMGELLDRISEQSVKHGIPQDFFFESILNRDSGKFALRSEDGTHKLQFEPDNIIFSINCYEKEKKVDLSIALKYFRAFWTIANDLLKYGGVKRIGIVAEHRFELVNPSSYLIKKFTNLEHTETITRFVFRYEDRTPLIDGKKPDVAKDAFFNTIHDLYDSIEDSEYKVEDCVNYNIDVQQYFTKDNPGTIPKNLKTLGERFLVEQQKVLDLLKSKGIGNGQ